MAGESKVVIVAKSFPLLRSLNEMVGLLVPAHVFDYESHNCVTVLGMLSCSKRHAQALLSLSNLE